MGKGMGRHANYILTNQTGYLLASPMSHRMTQVTRQAKEAGRSGRRVPTKKHGSKRTELGRKYQKVR